MSLVNKQAAMIMKDAQAPDELVDLALETVNSKEKLESLSMNIKKLALPDSANIIADEVLKLAEEGKK